MFIYFVFFCFFRLLIDSRWNGIRASLDAASDSFEEKGKNPQQSQGRAVL